MYLSNVNVKHPNAFIRHPFVHLLRLLDAPPSYKMHPWYQVEILSETFRVQHATIKASWSQGMITAPCYTLFNHIINTISVVNLQKQFAVDLEHAKLIDDGILEYWHKYGGMNRALTVETSKSLGIPLLQSSITKLAYFEDKFKTTNNWYRKMSKIQSKWQGK